MIELESILFVINISLNLIGIYSQPCSILIIDCKSIVISKYHFPFNAKPISRVVKLISNQMFLQIMLIFDFFHILELDEFCFKGLITVSNLNW